MAWKRLYRGVYVLAHHWVAMTVREQHLCRASGRALALQPGWHAARRTAALAHGFPLLGTVPSVPQLVHDLTTRAARAASRHERLAPLPLPDRASLQGLLLTSAPRTVVDLARQEAFRSAVVVADAALRAGTTKLQLEQVRARCGRWPGARQVPAVINFADGLAESALESISRVACHQLGLPVPELQIEVWLGGIRLARTDFLWRTANLIGLADGAVKYASRSDVMAEKWQVERLEDLGIEVVRWGWQDAYRGRGAFEAKIRRGLERGARQQRDPTVRLVSTTIAANLAASSAAGRRRAS
jgi:hypothetical protein